MVSALFIDAQDDLKYLKILSEHRINVAMKSGDLVILKYLYEHGYIWRVDSMEFAAQEGHLDCMKYAHENGCEWTYHTLTHIAGSGNVECLACAATNGCVKDCMLTGNMRNTKQQ